jgi:outer membrane cobalamin receptor
VTRKHFSTSGGRLRTLAARTAFVLACAAPWIEGAAAEERRPDESNTGASTSSGDIELAPILVDAQRTEEEPLVERTFDTPDDGTGFGEVIFAEPLWRSSETTAELLGESVGAQIRRQGGRDDFSSLSIRGAPAAQLRILLDGVALGSAADSIVNLANLPSDLVERIEMYRGFSPVSLTPVSSAGVVNVITRDPERAATTAAFGGGSFGTMKMNGGGAGPVLGGSASAFAAWRHTDGDFDFVDENSASNPNDDVVRPMKNNDSDAVESLLRWHRGLTDSTKLQLRNHVFFKDEGVPDIEEDSGTRTRLETLREIAAATVAAKSGRWQADQIVTWEQKELGDSSNSFDNTSATTASTTQARWSRPVGKSSWLSGSADYTWEDFDQRFEGSGEGAQAVRHSLAAAVGDELKIDPLLATLSLQLRHHQIWNDSNVAAADAGTDHSTDPRVGLKWEPVAGLAIKGNVSTYFRPPTFDELYGTDGFTIGNPGLVPETGLAWDAGLEWSAERAPYGRVSVGYAWFGSNIDDIIVVRLNFDRESRASNVSEAEIRGHELRLDWKGPHGVSLSANYTHQDAIDRSGFPGLDGLDLPGIAPDEGWARISWAYDRFVLAYDIEVTGAHFLDSENEEDKLPTRTVHGVSLVYGPFWKGLRITLEGNNLSDSLLPDVIGYPLPGRSFHATLSWSSPRDGEDTNAM